MTVEWLMVGSFLAGVLVLLGGQQRSILWRLSLIGLYLGSMGALGWRQSQVRQQEATRATLAEKVPQQGRPGGYVSSDNCKSCHPDQYASWHRSFHRTMTQLASPRSVRGEFDRVTLELGGESYFLEQRGDEFWVDMVDPDWRYVQQRKRATYREIRGAAPTPAEANPPRARKRITMLTGSHHMQAYWVASDSGNMQFSFPFTYLFEARRWVPRNDVFLFDPSVRFSHQVWNTGCLNCHATGGQPRQDVRTKVMQTRAAELGIACEACHGPADQHVRVNLDPARRYQWHRANQPDPTIFNAARLEHVKASEACGQCHAIRRNLRQGQWNLEGIGYRPGEDLEAKAPLVHYDGAGLDAPGHENKRALMEGSFWSDGQVRVSGREFNGLFASACFQRGQMSCLSCHSLHKYQDTDDQLAVRMEGNQACLQCHNSFAAALEQHTRHRAGSTGSLCYNCHMPHTTYGLLKAIRSHTITSPNVQSSLATGRPNACNLCHLDKSLGWTSDKLKDWYRQPAEELTDEQKTISAGASWILKGDAGQRALLAWHMGWVPAQQISGTGWMPRLLAELLVDPYSNVRYIAQRSLKRLPGYAQLSCDFIGPEAGRENARQRALEIWRGKLTADGSQSVRSQPNELLEEAKVVGLLKERNDRHMELLE